MKHNTKKILITAAAITGLLLSIYLFPTLYFQDRFVLGSSINGISYAGKTVMEVEQDIDDKINAYTLTLTGRNDVEAVIHASDINYHYVKDDQIAKLKEAQDPFSWPLALFNKNDLSMEATTAYDEELLSQVIKKLPFFSSENNIAPENAAIVYTETDGFQIQPEKENSQIKGEVLASLIKDCLEQGITSLVLEDYGCYEEPFYRASSPEVLKALEAANTYTGLTITYDFGSRSEVLDQSTLHDWITISEDFKVSIIKEKIEEYVKFLNYHYTTFGIAREFTKEDGKTITIRGGDYGWWINRGAEAKELLSILKKGEDVTREPVYFQTAASREPDDIGSSYVEVNLKKQKLWVFIDGEKQLESDIVTGNLSRNYGTPGGIYDITYKERNATLVGENYATPVKYWMPFNGNIGFHDASWRNKFGKDIYKTSGSHGCVNMPPKKAAEMFDLIKKGTPVIVY